MKLYHSSNVIVENPDILHSRKYLDFGRGFYLTSLYDQAVRYAQRFKRRGQQAWLNTYELAEDVSCQWCVRKFDTYDKDWLDFVAQCRDGKEVGKCDSGLLRFEKPNIQYCIRSEQMLRECLTYIKSEKI